MVASPWYPQDLQLEERPFRGLSRFEKVAAGSLAIWEQSIGVPKRSEVFREELLPVSTGVRSSQV